MIDWPTILNQFLGSLPALIASIVAIYLAVANRRKTESETRLSDAEIEALEQKKRLELETYYEKVSDELQTDLETVRQELKEIKAEAIRTLSAFYFLVSKVKHVFPNEVEQAIRMLEQH